MNLSNPSDAASSFGGNAALYAAFRPLYPGAVFEALLARLEGPRERAVDLGAGSGQASRGLAAHFEYVAAVEADTRMLALMPPDGRITPVAARAEDADFPAGSVDAVIAATAFHWMDQRRVIANVHRWLRPGGVFFPFLFGPFVVEGEGAALFRRHRALWAAYRDPRLGAKADYSVALAQSGLFADISTFTADLVLTLSPDNAAGLFSTASYASAYARSIGGEADYFARLAAAFAAVCAAVTVRLPLGGVIAVKSWAVKSQIERV